MEGGEGTNERRNEAKGKGPTDGHVLDCLVIVAFVQIRHRPSLGFSLFLSIPFAHPSPWEGEWAKGGGGEKHLAGEEETD